MFLCGVLVLFFWQSTIYPVSGQMGSERMEQLATKVEKPQKLKIQSQVPDQAQVNSLFSVLSQGLSLSSSQAQTVEGVITVEIMMEDSISQGSANVSENSLHLSRGQQTPERTLEESLKDHDAKKQNFLEQDAKKHVAQEYVVKEEKPEEKTPKVKVSQADIDLLARVIYAEARGENFEGQVAVGAVVLNRLEGSGFPKTLHGVVYQPGAFTAVIDKQIHLTPDEEAYRAAEAALAGEDPTGGALYYFNPRTATDRWIKSRAVIKQIGNHTFSI